LDYDKHSKGASCCLTSMVKTPFASEGRQFKTWQGGHEPVTAIIDKYCTLLRCGVCMIVATSTAEAHDAIHLLAAPTPWQQVQKMRRRASHYRCSHDP
jgi:hypothetical protein